MMLITEIIDDILNTPANGYWTLTIYYTPIAEAVPRVVQLTFDVATGEFDLNRTSAVDITTANALVAPVINVLSSFALLHGVQIDFWKLINWTFVSVYWTVLADFGQDGPTIYEQQDLSRPVIFSSEYNIFVNSTLYSEYTTFLSYSVLPLMNLTAGTISFAPLDQANRLNVAQETKFLRGYPCNVRRMKAPINAVISILVADYVLIGGGYRLFILIAAWYQKRKIRECIILCVS